VGGPSSLAKSGGFVHSTGCVVPQLFAAGGNQPYLDYWAVTGDPQYLGHKTPTSPKIPLSLFRRGKFHLDLLTSHSMLQHTHKDYFYNYPITEQRLAVLK
jgi:hypothetical protein